MKNIILFVSLAIALAAPQYASALSVQTVTEGTLATAVGTSTDASRLDIAGPVDAADLFWLGENMPNLTALDLSAATILPYSGQMLRGAVSWPAATIPDGAFAGTRLQQVVLPASATTDIGAMAFADTQLSALPTGTLGALGMAAFANCRNIVTATLPADVTIGAYVMEGCTALVSANLSGATTVPEGLFRGCTSLSDVQGAENVVTIGARAFDGCKKLANYTFGENLRSIGDGAFAASGLAVANMDRSSILGNVGAWAFANCGDLDSAVFNSQDLVTLGKGVFFNCSNLTTLILPESYKSLPGYALKGVEQAPLTHISATADSIGEYALKDAHSITDLVLPANLTYIGDGAMEGATSLASINASALQQVPALGVDVWRGIDQSNVRLDVENDLADQFASALQWQDFNINRNSGSGSIVDESVNAAVKARFVGDVLHVAATGSKIDAISVYDPAGILLVSLMPYADTAEIDTAGFSTQLYIVAVRLDNGLTATAKLRR